MVCGYSGRCYLYEEGYVRTSSTPYADYDPDLPSDEQIFMQLTNNAVQKNGEDYGKFEEGNIVSLDTLFNQIANTCDGKNKTKEELKSKFLSDV